MSIQDLWNKEARKAMLEKDLKVIDIAVSLDTSKAMIYKMLNKSVKESPLPFLRAKVSKLLEIPTPDELEMSNKKSL